MSVASVQFGHFLIIDGITDSWVRVYDGPFKPVTHPRKDFESGFSGMVLIPSDAIKSSGSVRRVWADMSVVDAGEVPAGTTVVESFAVHTCESLPVRLVDFSRCCGRQIIVPADMEIRPGRKNEVKVSTQVPVGVTALDETVYLVTDRPRWPLVPLTIVGRVLDEVRVIPQVIDFRIVTRGACVVKKVNLMRVSPDRAQSMSLSCSAGFLRAEKKSYDENTRLVSIGATLDTKGLQGRVSGNVLVRMGSGTHAVELNLPVTAQVTGPVTVSPQEFMLGFVRRGVASSAKVMLSCEEPGFTVTGAKAPDGVTVRTRKIKGGYKIEAGVSPGIGFQELDDKIVVRTSLPDDREIEIPIYASLDPASSPD